MKKEFLNVRSFAHFIRLHLSGASKVSSFCFSAKKKEEAENARIQLPIGTAVA